MNTRPDPEQWRQVLRAFSPAAARAVAAHPPLLGSVHRAPPLFFAKRAMRLPPDAARIILRRLRTRLFVHTAAAEARGEAPLHTARLWTRFAESCIATADAVVFRELCSRHGIPQMEDGQEVPRAIFGLGKLGARELNPSSDVDLLFAYGTDHGAAGQMALHPFFTRWAQATSAFLSEATDTGFVFRVDLDLRPEGTRGPVVNSADALERYYERFGLTWERAALLRMRPVVDGAGLGNAILKRLRPFITPKSLSTSVIDDLAVMKGRVTASARTEGFDVKRGQGGIREVEFIAQVLQLLHVGRQPQLRVWSTVDVLTALEQAGLLAHETSDQLRRGYAFLRRLEHALQFREDQQTQFLPDDGEIRNAIRSHFDGLAESDTPSFEAELQAHRDRIGRAFSEILEDRPEAPQPRVFLALDERESDGDRKAALTDLGFVDADAALRLLKTLRKRRGSPFSPHVQSRNSQNLVLAGRLLEEAGRSLDPDAALARLVDLFGGALHKALLGQLRGNPPLIRLLIRILSASPALARHLSRQRGLEATLLYGVVTRRPNLNQLKRSLEEDLPTDDEEAALVRMRRVHGRVSLAVGTAFLAGRLDVFSAQHRLSILAQALVRRALDIALAKVERRHGSLPGARFSVCAQGALGARELGFSGDLDLLFVYDGEGKSQGERPLEIAGWAARIAQQVIWALSASLPEGRCYEVDTRLRPSGSQGPLCISLPGFVSYQEKRARFWERQALLRMRPVAGHPGLGQSLNELRRRAIAFGEGGEAPAVAVGEMRDRIQAERGRARKGAVDLKLSAGGLVDIEFAIQAQLMAAARKVSWHLAATSTRTAIRRLAQAGHLDPGQAEEWVSGLGELKTARELLWLVDPEAQGILRPGDPTVALLAKVQATRGPVEPREVVAPEALQDRFVDGLKKTCGRMRTLADATFRG
jgi:glutamate-ammonia-ligase adenylyltransferase